MSDAGTSRGLLLVVGVAVVLVGLAVWTMGGASDKADAGAFDEPAAGKRAPGMRKGSDSDSKPRPLVKDGMDARAQDSAARGVAPADPATPAGAGSSGAGEPPEARSRLRATPGPNQR